MKVGDSILCIDNRVTRNYLKDKEMFIVGLTKDKWYTIVNFKDGYTTIKDDFNRNFNCLFWNRFITLEEFRDQKLKEIGI